MSWQINRIEAISEKHTELKGTGFALAVNVSGLPDDRTYDLGSGVEIRKATDSEIETVRELMEYSPDWNEFTCNPYENDLRIEETGKERRTIDREELPREKWKYHVFTFHGSNGNLNDFNRASVLTSTRLDQGPVVFNAGDLGNVVMWVSPALNRLLSRFATGDKILHSLGESELHDLKSVHERLWAFDNSVIDLGDALSRFEQMDSIPEGSPMQFLGYVSVLESIITHAPKKEDPYDSLTRQITKKMLLLSKRSKLPVPYDEYYPREAKDTIWKKLYGYRSEIAHGGSANCQGEFQLLKNMETALGFIRGATVAVLRQTLEEPQLIADLHYC